MSRTLDPDSLGFVITDVGRLLRAAAEKRMSEAGGEVTPGEARVLMHAAALGGGRQALLAERLGVEPMTISGYVDRLEQRGLVERRPDPNDGRAKLVHVTDAADAVIDASRALARATLDDAMGNATSEERAVLERLLKEMRTNLQDMLGAERQPRQAGAAA